MRAGTAIAANPSLALAAGAALLAICALVHESGAECSFIRSFPGVSLSHTGFESSAWGLPQSRGLVTIRLTLRGDFDDPATEYVSVYLNGVYVGDASSGINCDSSTATIELSPNDFNLSVAEGFATIRIVASPGVGFECSGTMGVASAALLYDHDFCLKQILQASTGPLAGGEFGLGMAMSSSSFLVGASGATVGGVTAAGRVEAFAIGESGPWSFSNTLTAPQPTAGDRFGRSISLHNDHAVVGAPYREDGSDVDAGSAWIFTRSIDGHWGDPVQLSRVQSGGGDHAGWSVAIFDDWAFVGVPLSDMGGVDSGRVVAFRSDGAGGWVETQSISAANTASGDRFGECVAADGRRLFVGAPRNDVGANSNQGSVHVFEESSGVWTEVSTITASDGATNDLFGEVIAVDNRRILVSAQGRDISGLSNAGCAYPFTLSGDDIWVPDGQTIVSANIEAEAQFGWHLDLQGARAVVGAWTADIGQPTPTVVNAGTVEVFSYADSLHWAREVVLTSETAEAYDTFGRMVVMHGTTLAIAAPLDDTGGGSAGIVYCYNLSADCDGDDIDDTEEILADPRRDCNLNGWLDSCEIAIDPTLDADIDGRLDQCNQLLDLNQDGLIDGHDLAYLLAGWGTPVGDVNGDGLTDGHDLSLLMTNWR